jgi:uncharacterized membrane protein YdjX (TVP38/TMEM64 family)
MPYLRDLHTLLSEEPLLLFLAIVILPGIGCPVSFLFTLAGIVWGTSVKSCLLVVSALALNLTWTYFLARSTAGTWLHSRLPAKWQGFFEAVQGSGFHAILVFRLTPGMPLFIQNYALGLLRVPFFRYLPLSLLLSSLWACAFVVSGGAVFRGNVGYAIIGASLFVIAVIVRKFLRRYSSQAP